MAAETVAIMETGRYTGPDGRTVEIAGLLRPAVSGTVFLEPATVPVSEKRQRAATRLSVTDETTLAALARMADGGSDDLAALNFASAKNPGGGFLGGAEAQEESLARSSGLYPCLLAAPEYYERNRASRSCIYLDLAIWSPGVPFIRDDSGELLSEPFTAGIITAPAPNAGAVLRNEPSAVRLILPTLERRAGFVLSAASGFGVRRLVLGAWGCGVFRNSPAQVADVFARLLTGSGEFSGSFDEVVFAVYDRTADRHILNVFRDVFTPDRGPVTDGCGADTHSSG